MKAGYQPQYARNTLQLNRGGGRFSVTAQPVPPNSLATIPAK